MIDGIRGTYGPSGLAAAEPEPTARATSPAAAPETTSTPNLRREDAEWLAVRNMMLLLIGGRHPGWAAFID
jgi:hypothetical protein